MSRASAGTRGRSRAHSRSWAGRGAHPCLDALGTAQAGAVGGPGGGDVLEHGAPGGVAPRQVGQPYQQICRPPGTQRLSVHVPVGARHGLYTQKRYVLRCPGSEYVPVGAMEPSWHATAQPSFCACQRDEKVLSTVCRGGRR